MATGKLLPKFKKFNGVTYTWETELPRKADAEAYAKRMRAKGINARVVKGGSFGWAHTVYIRK